MKLGFVLVEVALAVVFGATTFRHQRNAGAVVEWVISLIFTAWVLSFGVDLWPAVRGGQVEAEGEVEEGGAEVGEVGRGGEGGEGGMAEVEVVRKPGGTVAGAGDADGVLNHVNGVNGAAMGNGHAHVAESV